jgi:hypothetical protein
MVKRSILQMYEAVYHISYNKFIGNDRSYYGAYRMMTYAHMPAITIYLIPILILIFHNGPITYFFYSIIPIYFIVFFIHSKLTYNYFIKNKRYKRIIEMKWSQYPYHIKIMAISYLFIILILPFLLVVCFIKNLNY